MAHIITIVVFVLLIVLLVFSGVRKTFAAASSRPGTVVMMASSEGKPPLATDNLTREQVAKRLKKLSKSPPPAKLSLGAMCYEVAAPPDRGEYVCPVCGQKTLYTRAREQGQNNVDMVLNDIPECRRMVKAIKGLNLTLDESEFCHKCSPAVKSPGLILIVRYPGEKKPHRVRNVSSSDLEILQLFITGQDRVAGFTGTETPLKEYLPRLQELLGIKIRL